MIYLFFDIISRARSMALISAVEMELSLGRPFLRTVFIKNSCRCFFIVILCTVCEYILVVWMMQEDSMKFFYISARMCFCFGGDPIIRGLVLVFQLSRVDFCVMMLLCTFAREIVDSLRIGPI